MTQSISPSSMLWDAKMWTKMGLMALLIVYSSSVRAAELYPVVLFKPLKFKTEEVVGIQRDLDLERLSKLPLDLAVDDVMSVELCHPDKGGERRHPATCEEYNNDLKEGWSTYTTFARTVEGHFIHVCSSLKLLARAKVSLVRSFETLPMRIEDMSFFPRELITDFDYYSQPSRLCNGTNSFAECAKLENISVRFKGDQLRYRVNGWDVLLAPALKADLNNDGYEDVVYFYAQTVVGGTMRSYGHVCIEKPKGAKQSRLFSCFE